MAVQTVLRDGRDFRGLAGTITSGQIKVGDRIIDKLSGQSAKVARIVTMDRDLKSATVGQAVTIQPDRDLDVARGALIATPGTEPASASEIEARLVWLADEGFDPKAGYLLRTATDLVPISGFEIKGLIELETLESPSVYELRRQRHRGRRTSNSDAVPRSTSSPTHATPALS